MFLLASRHGNHYGFPSLDGRSVKIAKHHHFDETVDPDRVERKVSAADEAAIRAALSEFIPAADGPLAAAKTCLYTVTPDHDFIVDRLPDAPNIVVALALLRPRLQVRPGAGRSPRRPRDQGRNAARHFALSAGSVRLIV